MDRGATVLILTFLLGCSGPPASGPIQVTRSQRGETVTGFYELPTGEITIARVDLTGKTLK